ncbi:MAG: hypothetical protein ACK4UT_01700 [Moraxellaceae bacterium]
MRQLILGSFALASSLFLAGCGNSDSTAGSGGVTPPATVAVSSAVVKGVIDGAVVKAAQWQDGAWVDVAEAATTAGGGFSLQLPASTRGILRLRLDLGADGVASMRCDAAAGCDGSAFGDDVTLTEAPGLLSWVEVKSDGSVVVMPMTPLSTLVVRYAEAIGGRLDSFSLGFARQRLALLLGMTPAPLLAPAGDVTSAVWVSTTDASGLKVSLLSAGFAELAAGQGSSVNALIDRYVAEFLANDGRLLEATFDGDDAPTLGALLAAARTVAQHVATTVSTTPPETLIADWQARIDSLQAYMLNTLPPMAGLDSNAWLTAMGALGDDIRTVMAASGASSLEQLVFNELNQFRWLLSMDSLALAQNAIGILEHVIAAMVQLQIADMFGGMGGSLPDVVDIYAEEGYSAQLTRSTRQLVVQGQRFGMDVDLVIGLTSLTEGALAKKFTFSAKGTLENARVRAHIDGTLAIDPKTTNLSELYAALLGGSPESLKQALNTLLTSGHGKFDVDGKAGIRNLTNDSELSVEGKAWAELQMNGHAGAVKLSGAINHGQLVLPNGDRFSIRKGSTDKLTFGMTDDAWLSARFLAQVLTVPDAVVTAEGKAKGLGKLVTHGRDSLVATLAAEEMDLGGLLANLLDFDLGSLRVTLTGEANVAAWGKVYRLAVDGMVLKIYQPNSNSEVALQVSLGTTGLMVQAGTQWLRIGFDWRNPALTLADRSGGELRLELSGLLAML